MAIAMDVSSSVAAALAVALPSITLSSTSTSQQPMVYFRSELKETTDSTGARVMNDWLIGGKLGSGGFASVRLATHMTSGHVAAMKRMSKQKLRQSRALGKVRREIDIMERLNHANITPLWGVLEEDDGDQLCLLLEYQAQGSLMSWNGDTLRYTSHRHALSVVNGGIEEKTLQPLFAGVVQGLIYLHERHIVHRDIKPDNILVSSNGIAKLADFGVAHRFDDDAKSATAAVDGIVRDMAGTLHFFSPECCAAQTVALAAADDELLPDGPPGGSAAPPAGFGGAPPSSSSASLPDSDELPMDGPPPPMPSWDAEPPSASAALGPPYNGYTSDIWALGVTLYTCVFGIVPWLCTDGNRDVLFGRIQKEPFVIPSGAVISESLRKLFAQILEKDPKKRITLQQLKAHEWLTATRA